MTFSILPKGAHHHAFIMAYSSVDDLSKADGGREICTSTGKVVDIVEHSLSWAEKLQSRCGQPAGHQGELAALCAYARSYPTNFLAQIDTYDALKSGLSNFLAVSLALHAAGYAPVGIALDSGDLAYQSKEARRIFRKVADMFEVPSFRDLRASPHSFLNYPSASLKCNAGRLLYSVLHKVILPGMNHLQELSARMGSMSAPWRACGSSIMKSTCFVSERMSSHARVNLHLVLSTSSAR
jgi:hypothetical protein